MRRRRIGRKRLKHQKMLLTIGALSIMMFLTVGYAAFQTNINLNIKGNVKAKPKSANNLISDAVTTGDGLYADEIQDDDTAYVYRGANPNNYVLLGNDLYRIIEIDTSNNIKIAKNTPITSIVWDAGYYSNISSITPFESTSGTRISNNSSDYCYESTDSSYGGCKVWGSSTSTLSSNGNTTTQMPWEVGGTTKNLPTYDSYLNVYLNGGTYPTSSGTTNIAGWYINNVDSSVQNKIINHNWNIGPVKSESNQTLATDIAQASAYKWNGKIGIISAIDYAKTNSNSACHSVFANTYSIGNHSTCRNTTWLYDPSNSQWTMTPQSTSDGKSTWMSSGSGLHPYDAGNTYVTRPSFYLDSCVKFKGSGTQADPYEIVANTNCPGNSGGGSTPVTPTRTIDQTFVPQYYEYHTGNNVTLGQTADTTNWVQDSTELTGRNYFLGHDVDSTTGNVTANYACFVINDTQYCMRGKDGASGTNYFTQNKALLGVLKDAGTITCSTFDDSYASCSGSTVGYLSANPSASACTGSSGTVGCCAGYYGDSNCNE